MQSVERTAVIELFSTFFDRLSSSHPSRDNMMKELFHFKGLLYCNDGSIIDTYLSSLHLSISNRNQRQVPIPTFQEEKSPIRDSKANRDGSMQRVGNSQNKQMSQRKDAIQDKENNNVVRKLETTTNTYMRQSEENLDFVKQRLQQQSEISLRNLNSKTPASRLIKNNIISNNSNVLNVSSLKQDNDDQTVISNGIQSLSGTSRIARNAINSKRNAVFTSCGHEIDRDTFSQYVNVLLKEQSYVDCPVCSMQLPTSDYSHLAQANQFEDFKNKHLSILKSIKLMKKNDDSIIAILQQFEQDENFVCNKQRQFSSGGDPLKNLQKENSQSPFQMNGNSRVTQQDPEFNRFKKCLRCNKSVEGGSSYFCQACKNF